MTKDKKRPDRLTFAAAYAKHAPKSVCRCGHLGDGANSEHKDTFVAGHGACTKCPCAKFAWVRFTDRYKAAFEKLPPRKGKS